MALIAFIYHSCILLYFSTQFHSWSQWISNGWWTYCINHYSKKHFNIKPTFCQDKKSSEGKISKNAHGNSALKHINGVSFKEAGRSTIYQIYLTIHKIWFVLAKNYFKYLVKKKSLYLSLEYLLYLKQSSSSKEGSYRLNMAMTIHPS